MHGQWKTVNSLRMDCYKRREEIQAETNLTGEEKQQMLKEIDDEVEEYERLMEDE